MAYYAPQFTYLEVYPKREPTPEEIDFILTTIPGIKFRKWWILVPHHAVKLFAKFMDDFSFPVKSIEVRNRRAKPKTYEEIRADLVRKGEVQDWVFQGFLTPFQIDALEKTGHYQGAHLWHSTGSGKTLSSILWALLKPKFGRILCLTRATSRIQYGREYLKYTHLRPYVVKPSASMRKKDKTLSEYVQWTKENKQRPVVVCGWESVKANKEALLAYNPDIIVYDELHKGKGKKRYEAIPIPNYLGDPEDEREKTKFYKAQEWEARQLGGFIPDKSNPRYAKQQQAFGDQRVMIVPLENIVSICSTLSQVASFMLGTTATPIKNRVEDLWGQVDLIEPKSWGTFRDFAVRYCNGHQGLYGFDTKGESNLDELVSRLETVTHKVPYTETHKHLPQKRRQSVYVPPEQQLKPTRKLARELKAASKRGATAVIEVRLAIAAQSKRSAIMDMVADHLSSGHKITIFTGRRKDVEELTKKVKALYVVKKKGLQIWGAHGENSTEERQGIVDAYMASEKACALIGTGHSFGECVRPDEFILGDNKRIDQYVEGDRVFSAEGLTSCRGRKHKIFEGDLIEVRGTGTLPIATTPNHPFLVAEGSRTHDRKRQLVLSEPKWKSAEDLEVWDPRIDRPQLAKGDFLLIPRYKGEIESVEFDLTQYLKIKAPRKGLPNSILLDEDFAWLLGIYVAEGSHSYCNKDKPNESQRLAITPGTHQIKEIERVKQIISTLGFKVYERVCGEGTATHLEVKSTPLARLILELCGHRSEGKKIPLAVLFHSNTKILRSFIDGYAAGDGSQVKDKVLNNPTAYQAATVSPILARHLQLALARLGRLGRLTPVKGKKTKFRGKEYQGRDYFIISWSWETKRHPHWKVLEDYIAVPIKKKEFISYSGEVVDIGTKSRNFLAGNVIVHNSLNIHDTDAAFFVQLPYTPGELRQWEGRFCLLAGQKILTQKGVKNIENIEVGDWVLTHKGRFRPVVKVGNRKLRTGYGNPRRSILVTMSVVGCPYPLQLTADHPVLVSVDGADPIWKEAGRVCMGDELVTPRLKGEIPSGSFIQFPPQFRINPKTVKNGRYISMPEWIEVDEELAWVMGHFCGDGFTATKQTQYVGIAGNPTSKDGHLARAAKVFERFGIKSTIKPASKGNGINLYAYSKGLALWWRSMFGDSSHNKRIPSFVFSWNEVLRKSFMQGYFDADGHKHKKKGAQEWTTVSEHLAMGIFHLASGTGFPATTSMPPSQEKSSRAYKGGVNPRSKIKIDEDYVYRRIGDMTIETPKGENRDKIKVYDITVQEDESFCANGVVVHNCRLGQKRPVIIYYVIAEGTIDEHVADLLINKLPAVEKVAGDVELAEAEEIIGGIDDMDFLSESILNKIDEDSEEE